MDTSDLVAAFLAKGGTVRRVEEGARTLTERELWAARISPNKVSREAIDEQRLIDERHDVNGHVRNGLGEWIS